MVKRNIFIVEDEAINAILIKFALQNEHLILGVASSGKEAIKEIIEKKPDLIIVDIRLDGDLTGIDVMNEVNKTMRVDHIYCTAYSDKTIIDKAMETCPFKIILKPVNVIDLKKLAGGETGITE